jgi:hypothetical protein
MTYRVVWTDKAIQELADIWLKAPDRGAVNTAADLIDRILKSRPLDERHEVVNGFGTALSVPVGVDFGLDAKNRLVIVVAAWFAIDD